MENLVVVAGNSNPELFKKIEQEICTMDAGDPNFSLAKATIGKFPGGEPKIKINRNLRGKTVYVLQSTSNSWKPDQNSFADNLVELLVLEKGRTSPTGCGRGLLRLVAGRSPRVLAGRHRFHADSRFLSQRGLLVLNTFPQNSLGV